VGLVLLDLLENQEKLKVTPAGTTHLAVMGVVLGV
jgi:hypothetical protein